MLNGALGLSPRSAGKPRRRRLAALHNPPCSRLAHGGKRPAPERGGLWSAVRCYRFQCQRSGNTGEGLHYQGQACKMWAKISVEGEVEDGLRQILASEGYPEPEGSQDCQRVTHHGAPFARRMPRVGPEPGNAVILSGVERSEESLPASRMWRTPAESLARPPALPPASTPSPCALLPHSHRVLSTRSVPHSALGCNGCVEAMAGRGALRGCFAQP